MTPSVSVVVATRNRRALLARALAGAAAQRYRDFEIVVVDDGSTDGTVQWLRAERPDVRLVQMARPGGAAAARNRGIESASGRLVAFLDDDDIWRPSYLEAQVEHLGANPAAALSYADHLEIDPAGRRYRPDIDSVLPEAGPLARLLAESPIHTMSVVVVRREAFDRLGLLDERLAIVHDLEWYTRLLAVGDSMARLPRPLVDRSVPGGLVTSYREWFQEERRVIEDLRARSVLLADDELLVRVYRSLFFARIALAGGDVAFGFARLAEAALCSPRWTVRIAARRLARRRRHERQVTDDAWTTPAESVA